jgi:hypothetical protein
MSGDGLNLDILNRRTVIAAVRSEAARAGVDAERLLDSARFYNEAVMLDVDSPDFPRRIREMVSSAGVSSAQPAGQAPATQPAAAPDDQRQWTDDDVKNASNDELDAAIARGQLTGMGVGPRRRRR